MIVDIQPAWVGWSWPQSRVTPRIGNLSSCPIERPAGPRLDRTGTTCWGRSGSASASTEVFAHTCGRCGCVGGGEGVIDEGGGRARQGTSGDDEPSHR